MMLTIKNSVLINNLQSRACKPQLSDTNGITEKSQANIMMSGDILSNYNKPNIKFAGNIEVQTNHKDDVNFIEEEYGMKASQDTLNKLVEITEKACDQITDNKKPLKKLSIIQDFVKKSAPLCEKLEKANYYYELSKDQFGGNWLNELNSSFETINFGKIGKTLADMKNEKARDLIAWVFGYTILAQSADRNRIKPFVNEISNDNPARRIIIDKLCQGIEQKSNDSLQKDKKYYGLTKEEVNM